MQKIISLKEFRERRAAEAERASIDRDMTNCLLPILRGIETCMEDSGTPLACWRASMPESAGKSAVGFVVTSREAGLSPMKRMPGDHAEELPVICAYLAGDKAFAAHAIVALGKALPIVLEQPAYTEISRDNPDWEMLYNQELAYLVREHVLVPARAAAKRGAASRKKPGPGSAPAPGSPKNV